MSEFKILLNEYVINGDADFFNAVDSLEENIVISICKKYSLEDINELLFQYDDRLISAVQSEEGFDGVVHLAVKDEFQVFQEFVILNVDNFIFAKKRIMSNSIIDMDELNFVDVTYRYNLYFKNTGYGDVFGYVQYLLNLIHTINK